MKPWSTNSEVEAVKVDRGFYLHLNTECMKFLEKDLEQIIFESSYHELAMRDLYLHGKKYRQLKIGNYGIADLVYALKPYYDTDCRMFRKGLITVVELKQDKVSVSSFFQAVKYVKGIQRYLELHRPSMENLFEFQIVLIGKRLDCNSSVVYLPEIFQPSSESDLEYQTNRTSVSIYTYDFSINGLFFTNESGYQLEDEFKI